MALETPIGFPTQQGYLGIGSLPYSGGRNFFVCNRTGITNGDGKTPKRPYSTLAEAFKAASNFPTDEGARIHVLPGHVEYITAADAWSSLTSTNTMIIGYGGPGRRPKLVWKTAAAAQIILAKAGTWLHNFDLILYNSAADLTITSAISVTAACVKITGCYIETGSVAARGAAIGITAGNSADYFQFGGPRHLGLGNEVYGAEAAGDALMTSFLTVGTSRNVRIEGNDIALATKLAATSVITVGAAVNIMIRDNSIHNTEITSDTSEVCILGNANATGWIINNSFRIQTDAITTWIKTPGKMQGDRNFGVNNDGETGVQCLTASA